MFIQVIRADVADPTAVQVALDRWDAELRPGATGFLGSTAGLTTDGELFLVARFENEDLARHNSDRPEQAAWWSELERQAILSINDVDLVEALRQDLLHRPDLVARPAGRHDWVSTTGPPWFLRTADGQAHECRDLSVTYELRERHFLGYIGDLDAVLYLRDLTEDSTTLLVPAESVAFDYASRFAEFSTVSLLPTSPRISVGVAVLPEPGDVHSGRFAIRRVG